LVRLRRNQIVHDESRAEAEMARYEMVFDDGATPRVVPEPGQTIDIGGVLFDVERVEQDADCPRLHLSPHGEADVEAHWRRRVALAPPTSFEGDLVYTLRDIATQLSTLAGTLDAYWNRGAA
jgi:hypothetical protein